MSRLERRLRKVEAAFPAIDPVFTREEIHVGQLRLVLALYRRSESEEARGTCAKLANRLAKEICSTVKNQTGEQFKRHIAEYVQPMWQTRFGRPQFLPPVWGSEYDDWEIGDLYQRRVAMRHDPFVIGLIGAPDAALGPPEYVIPFDQIFLSLRRKFDERNEG